MSASSPSLPHPPLAGGGSADELPPSARRLLTVGVLLLHVGGVWGLLQVESVREAAREAAPLLVDLIAPAPVPPPPRPPEPVRIKRPPPPLVTAAPTPIPSTSHFVAEPPPPEPVAAAPVEAPPAAPPAPAPAAPAVVRVSASALQYLVQPPVEVPRMSRRLGESGTVLVRVVVDMNGAPRVVALHKSSGFARLDEQAVGAMRAARFKPCSRDGVAFECEAIAGIAYELEN